MRRKLRRAWLKARYYQLLPLLVWPTVPLALGAIFNYQRGGTAYDYIVALVGGEFTLFVSLPIVVLFVLWVLTIRVPEPLRSARRMEAKR